MLVFDLPEGTLQHVRDGDFPKVAIDTPVRRPYGVSSQSTELRLRRRMYWKSQGGTHIPLTSLPTIQRGEEKVTPRSV